MKTVFKNGVYERVDNEVAETRVNNQGWKFVPKSEWKTNARPAVSEKSLVEQEKKETTLSDKALRRKKLGEKQREGTMVDSWMAK
jgi:hypothetical protein